MEFLYAPDSEGHIGWKHSHYLLEVCEPALEEHASDVYGYSAWVDAFTFGDFVEMLRDSVDNTCPLWWW